MKTKTEAPNVCPCCKAKEFEWGWLHSFGQAASLKFTLYGNYSWAGNDGKDIRARRCVGCGHLDLFVK